MTRQSEMLHFEIVRARMPWRRAVWKINISIIRILLGLSFLILSSIGFVGCVGQTPLPVVTATPDPTDVAFAQLSFDFTTSMLMPTDIADLFPGTTYAIQQQLKGPGMQGLMVTYPTRVIEHTSGFAEGFATQIKIFADEGRATRAFDAAVAQQDNDNALAVGNFGDASRAFEGSPTSPEGFDLGSTEYVVLIRQRKALVTLTLRRNESVPVARLSELAGLVLARLDASAIGK